MHPLLKDDEHEWMAAVPFNRAGLRGNCYQLRLQIQPGILQAFSMFSRHIYNRLLELLLSKQYRKDFSKYLLDVAHLVDCKSFVLYLHMVEMNHKITTDSLNMSNSLILAFRIYTILISKIDLSKFKSQQHVSLADVFQFHTVTIMQTSSNFNCDFYICAHYYLLFKVH